MQNIFKESLILSTIYSFIIFLQEGFRESFTYSFFTGLANKFNYLVMNSSFWPYFYRLDRLDQVWRSSMVNRVLSSILNLPTRLLRLVYKKTKDILEASLIHKFLVSLSDNFHGLMGLVLVFTLVIPDHRWYNAYGVLTVFGLLALYLFKTVVDRDYNFNLDDLDLASIIFIMAIVLSFLLSLFPRDSLKDFIYFGISFASVLILVNSIQKRRELDKLVNYLVLASFLTVVYGFYQWKVVGIEVNPSLTDITINQGMSGRVFSSMGNPNVYGELLVLTMPFFLALILNARSLLGQAFYGLGFLMSLVILLKTGSRSAWVSFGVAMGAFIFFKNKKLLPVFVLLGFSMLPFLPDSIYRRLLTIFNPNDTSIRYRKEILQPAMPMLKDYWFTGVGLGTESFNTIYKRYKSFRLKTVAHTHNLFLQLWLEAGIVALVSFLWLGFRLIKKTVYIVKNSRDKKLINIAIAGLSALAGIVIMGFADHVWFYNRILFIFWIVVAIILASYKLVLREEKKIA